MAGVGGAVRGQPQQHGLSRPRPRHLARDGPRRPQQRQVELEAGAGVLIKHSSEILTSQMFIIWIETHFHHLKLRG